MNKNKLKLTNLKLQSFVTGMDKSTSQTAKGGVIISVAQCGNTALFCLTNDHCCGSREFVMCA